MSEQTSNSLRILFVTHGTPFPIRSGGHMYSANVIATLSARDDVDLTVLAIGTETSTEHVPPGATWRMSPPARGSGMVRGLFGKFPRSTAATISTDYRRSLKTLLTEAIWDVVVIDYIAIGWVLDDIIEHTTSGETRVVYLSHNVESTLRRRIAEGYVGVFPLRLIALRDGEKAAQLEEAIFRSVDFVTAETEEDASEFRSLYGPKKIHIYTPGYDGHVVPTRAIPLAETPRDVAIIGSRIATMKRLVLDELLKSIAANLNEHGVRLVVAGEAPREYLASCAHEYPYVNFHGYVADLAPLLTSVRLGLITDHIGGGFKHRILTLVFNRVPIVATREAMAGVPLTPGVHYVEVTGYDAVATTIGSVIDNFELLEELQNAAFEACRLTFDWNATTDGFVSALHAEPAERR